jgi:hypothetical protein
MRCHDPSPVTLETYVKFDLPVIWVRVSGSIQGPFQEALYVYLCRSEVQYNRGTVQFVHCKSKGATQLSPVASDLVLGPVHTE